MTSRVGLYFHQGRVGGGILGLVGSNGLEVSRVGNDDGAGAARVKGE